MESNYETVAERDGVKFEIVTSNRVGLFGEPVIEACRFEQVMRPTTTRTTLGTYRTRAEAMRRLEQEMENKTR
jgi:hypothetical protein